MQFINVSIKGQVLVSWLISFSVSENGVRVINEIASVNQRNFEKCVGEHFKLIFANFETKIEPLFGSNQNGRSIRISGGPVLNFWIPQSDIIKKSY